jgi:hypothetical protein
MSRSILPWTGLRSHSTKLLVAIAYGVDPTIPHCQKPPQWFAAHLEIH